MNDIIHLLPDAVANQIAAGEVIQRPASALKELVENAIDAGSSYIQIVFKDAGRTLLQVTDNGKGMSVTDARMAFERHATSKISSASDLFAIRTMGFRGEALASIASVAQVEMRTRRADDELGVFIDIAGSRIQNQETIHCPVGTTILVKNLFFNVPARRRFLKSDAVEKNHLLNEFYRIVLVHPDVEFALFDNDEELMHLPVSNMKIRIEQVFGHAKKKLSQQLLPIEAETGMISIHGFIGRPEFAQKSAQQYFFVNGRYMRHPYFHKSVMLAYTNLIATGDNPFYFIYFDVDPQSIDINIHPTKTEIKFEHEQAIWSILSATVKEALGKFNVVPSIDFDREGAPEMPLKVDPSEVYPPKTEFNPAYNPFSGSGNAGGGNYKRPVMDWEKLYVGFEGVDSAIQKSDSDNQFAFNLLPEVDEQQQIHLTEDSFTGHFQLKNRYIITSVKSGMLMIDQRRAHTRILYDQFLLEITQQQGFSQQLLFPETLVLQAEEIDLFAEIQSDLTFVGFDFEILENKEIAVKGIPAQMKGTQHIGMLIHNMIRIVANPAEHVLTALHEQIALQLAEAASIQSVQKLSGIEMNDIVEKLFACQDHHYTPTGKPIMTIWTTDEIQKRFE